MAIRISVSLASGKSVEVELPPEAKELATPISYLVTGSGHVLPPHGALHGALADQEEITAIVGQWPKVAASMTAFACVKADGSVEAWGPAKHGGDCSGQVLRKNVVKIRSNLGAFAAVRSDGIHSTSCAFAALLGDGSLVTWGDPHSGGDSQEVNDELHDVRQIQANMDSFAVIRADGSAFSWGSASGSSEEIQEQLKEVEMIQVTTAAFAAICKDGHVVTWGNAQNGAKSEHVQGMLKAVQQIQATHAAFAALRSDGAVISWGLGELGGDSSSVEHQLQSVLALQATDGAFCALRADGSVVTWGSKGYGGDSDAVQEQLKEVQAIQATRVAFCALLRSGTGGEVMCWGAPEEGGDSSGVQEHLHNVAEIQANARGFAALKSDGSAFLVCWTNVPMKLMQRLALVALFWAQVEGFRRQVEKTGLRGPHEPKALLEELENVLGAGHREAAERRLQGLEDDLRVTFKALPKNQRGALEAPSARYALHRLFNKRHGWQIKGLESAGGSWNLESPVLAMGDRDRLGSYGLTLHELAVLAATMEGMFERDVEQRLAIVYGERQLALEAKSNWDEANALMWNYVAAFVTGVPVENLTEGDVTRAARQFTFRFPRHAEAQELLFEIAHEVVGSAASDAVYEPWQAFLKQEDFALLQTILSKFGQRLGALEDNECQVMKTKLTSLEYRGGNGLVRLGDFYADQEHFTEGAEYLRSSGVLDESDPEDPKVIIPNYLASPSNCVQPAGYYSICCFDECEALMDQVEKNLEAPMVEAPQRRLRMWSPAWLPPPSRPTARCLLDSCSFWTMWLAIMVEWCRFMAVSLLNGCTKPIHASAATQPLLSVPAWTMTLGTLRTPRRKSMRALVELVDQKAFESHVKSSLRGDISMFSAVGFMGMLAAKLFLGPRPSGDMPSSAVLSSKKLRVSLTCVPMKLMQRLALFALFWAQGEGFRRRARAVEKTGLRGPQEPKALLEELEEVLGAGHREAAERRLQGLEDDLRVTFKALPKNQRGALEAPSARYALHRLFNKRHGWQIKGLESAGGSWNVESPVLAMGDRVPPQMRELFEDRLGSYGLTLHELAVLAATMEGMFEKDVEQRLGIVYAERQLALEAKSNWDEANALMWNYVAAFISGVPVENLTEGDVTRAARQFTFRFPRHVEAQALLFEIAHEVVGPRASDAVYDFALLQKILSKFGQRLGALEDNECQVMKNKLTSLEYHSGNGLVRLGDFYGDQEHFTEGADYLRSSGVLDESDPEDPKVIIPNYLASPSNCVQPAGYYSICCFDECEALMDQVEKNLEAPMGSLELAKFCGGTAEKIASVVSGLASASQPANRTLSPRLLQLLDDVAGHHGGMVPLHGRLFAQWMHEAYPRECSYPATAQYQPRK
eukprot:g19192.t1